MDDHAVMAVVETADPCLLGRGDEVAPDGVDAQGPAAPDEQPTKGVEGPNDAGAFRLGDALEGADMQQVHLVIASGDWRSDAPNVREVGLVVSARQDDHAL